MGNRKGCIGLTERERGIQNEDGEIVPDRDLTDTCITITDPQ